MTPESLSLIEPKTAKPRSATDCPRAGDSLAPTTTGPPVSPQETQ